MGTTMYQSAGCPAQDISIQRTTVRPSGCFGAVVTSRLPRDFEMCRDPTTGQVCLAEKGRQSRRLESATRFVAAFRRGCCIDPLKQPSCCIVPGRSYVRSGAPGNNAGIVPDLYP